MAGKHEWRPIETAPKDGTAIWVASPYAGHGTGGMEPARFYGLDEETGRWLNIYTDLTLTWIPSHWMPLPAAPRAQEAA